MSFSCLLCFFVVVVVFLFLQDEMQKKSKEILKVFNNMFPPLETHETTARSQFNPPEVCV